MAVTDHTHGDFKKAFLKVGKRQVGRERALDNSEVAALVQEVPGYEPNDLGAQQDQEDALARWLQELPKKQVEVLCLKTWRNLTFHEIGGVLGISDGAARQSWNRAVKFL